jgi:hypothetical protein
MKSLESEWDALQEAYRTANHATWEYRESLRSKYRDEAYCSRGERKRLDALKAREDKACDRIFTWLDRHSPWDWHGQVSAHWTCSKLAAAQALSVSHPILPEEAKGYGTRRIHCHDARRRRRSFTTQTNAPAIDGGKEMKR